MFLNIELNSNLDRSVKSLIMWSETVYENKLTMNSALLLLKETEITLWSHSVLKSAGAFNKLINNEGAFYCQ